MEKSRRASKDGEPTAPDADGRFRAIFDGVNDGIFISDPATGRFMEINEPGCRMFGYSRAELLGRDVDALSSGVYPHTREAAIELNERARQGKAQIFEWQCRRKNGELFWTEISLRYAKFGETPGIVAIFRDIAERKRLNAQIIHMAQHDALTGLANRSLFMTALECEISKSARSGKQFAVLSLDLDHFKDVNDSAGHPIGDQLLRLVSERLRSKIRKGDSIARFGGDEFAILLGDKRTRDVIGRLADRIIKAVAKPFLIDGKEIHVGASIGIAIKGAKDLDAETLLSNADIALYRAKAEGRQIYRFYSDAMNEEVRSRIRLTRDLRFAVPGGQLFLVYQPQIRTETRRVIGVAALVRWRHPLHGVLEPDSFLAIAENCGMMGVLGHWVLAEACRQGRRWIDAGIAPVTIGVNLSTAQFKAPLELEKSILSVLAETNMPPHLLELETTENTLINLSIQHVEIIQRLRRRGIRFSLDDFGTGYSSLNYLRHVAVDRIKIAREFVTEVTTSKEAASIVKLILGLARDLGNEVIAEGVETPEQLNLLQSWNCPDVQGYCFSAPVSADAMTAVLTTGEMQPVTVLPAFAA